MVSNTEISEDLAAQISRLKDEIQDLWAHGRPRRITLGRKLRELHALLSKPHGGSWMITVAEELGIPYSTARDYMAEAAQADAPAEGHPYENRNDAEEHNPLFGVPVSDPQADAVVQAKEQGRREREGKKPARDILRIDFQGVTESVATDEQRKQFKRWVKNNGPEAFRTCWNAAFPGEAK